MDNLRYDEELEELIKLKKLKWLPWVGEKYATHENKILFIGESHYAKDPEDRRTYECKGKTREIVRNMGVIGHKADGDTYDSKFFVNTHNLIFGKNGLEKNQDFYDNIAFYNFVQEPMDGKNGRPNQNHMETGRDNFLELLKVLKPSMCIFLGFGAYKAINNSKLGLVKEMEWSEKIGRGRRSSRGRFGSIQTPHGHIIKLIFVKHPSSYFSWSSWNEYLFKKIPDQMNWFKGLASAN